MYIEVMLIPPLILAISGYSVSPYLFIGYIIGILSTVVKWFSVEHSRARGQAFGLDTCFWCLKKFYRGDKK